MVQLSLIQLIPALKKTNNEPPHPFSSKKKKKQLKETFNSFLP